MRCVFKKDYTVSFGNNICKRPIFFFFLKKELFHANDMFTQCLSRDEFLTILFYAHFKFCLGLKTVFNSFSMPTPYVLLFCYLRIFDVRNLQYFIGLDV